MELEEIFPDEYKKFQKLEEHSCSSVFTLILKFMLFHELLGSELSS